MFQRCKANSETGVQSLSWRSHISGALPFAATWKRGSRAFPGEQPQPARDRPNVLQDVVFAGLAGGLVRRSRVGGDDSGGRRPRWRFPVAVAMAGIGFNIQHDGNHGAYSSHRALNKAAALSLNLLGGDAYFWRYKHNIAHHTYPNISGADNDIYMGPFARMSPHDQRYWFHRFQYVYIWALYSFLAVKWQLVDDYRAMIRPRRVADTRFPRPRGWDQVCFWTGKVCFLTLAFGVPLLVGYRLSAVIGLYLLTMAVLGLTLATVFQLAHCVEEAEFRIPAEGSRQIDREWMTHQIETAVDFARDNRFLTWYLGGLNFRIEHHPVPQDLPRPLPGAVADRGGDVPDARDPPPVTSHHAAGDPLACALVAAPRPCRRRSARHGPGVGTDPRRPGNRIAAVGRDVAAGARRLLPAGAVRGT